MTTTTTIDNRPKVALFTDRTPVYRMVTMSTGMATVQYVSNGVARDLSPSGAFSTQFDISYLSARREMALCIIADALDERESLVDPMALRFDVPSPRNTGDRRRQRAIDFDEEVLIYVPYDTVARMRPGDVADWAADWERRHGVDFADVPAESAPPDLLVQTTETLAPLTNAMRRLAGYGIADIEESIVTLVSEWASNESTVRHLVHAYDDGTLSHDHDNLSPDDHHHDESYLSRDDAEADYLSRDVADDRYADRNHEHDMASSDWMLMIERDLRRLRERVDTLEHDDDPRLGRVIDALYRLAADIGGTERPTEAHANDEPPAF